MAFKHVLSCNNNPAEICLVDIVINFNRVLSIFLISLLIATFSLSLELIINYCFESDVGWIISD